MYYGSSFKRNNCLLYSALLFDSVHCYLLWTRNSIMYVCVLVPFFSFFNIMIVTISCYWNLEYQMKCCNNNNSRTSYVQYEKKAKICIAIELHTTTSMNWTIDIYICFSFFIIPLPNHNHHFDNSTQKSEWFSTWKATRLDGEFSSFLLLSL